jgi:predicted  nucleic acid-binding Zn-ribbon protein
MVRKFDDERINDQIDRLEERFDRLDIKLDKIADLQNANNKDWQEHMRRTEGVETLVSITQEEVKKLDIRVKPLEDVQQQAIGMTKLVKVLVWCGGAVVTGSAVINAIPKILTFFGH